MPTEANFPGGGFGVGKWSDDGEGKVKPDGVRVVEMNGERRGPGAPPNGAEGEDEGWYGDCDICLGGGKANVRRSLAKEVRWRGRTGTPRSSKREEMSSALRYVERLA